MRFSKRQAIFSVSIYQLNKTSYQKKGGINALKVWFGSEEANIGNILHLNSI